MVDDLKGKAVLITGASTGIGAAAARAFAAAGARVVVHYNESREPAEALAAELRRAGTEVLLAAGDVTQEANGKRIVAETMAAFGRVDVLINNAGAFAMAKFVDTTVADFDRMIAVNLRSAFLVTRAFLPAMLKRKHGDIFFMSSIAGLGAYPNAAGYCAAKFGVTGLAKVLRAETKGTGVRVCCVHPGATWSPSWRASGVKPERIMPAEDVARAFLDVYRLGRRTVVEEIVLRPERGDL